MVLVDGNVASNVVNFYMTWIACMLKKIELMTFSGVHLYKLYIDYKYLLNMLIAAGVNFTKSNGLWLKLYFLFPK